MKKFVKPIAVLMLLLPSTWFISHLYLHRSQTIDLTAKIPQALTICGKRSLPGDKSYEQVVSWLQYNGDGWISVDADYPTWAHIIGDEFDISLFQGEIRIEYFSGQRFVKVRKYTDTEELVALCSPKSQL